MYEHDRGARGAWQGGRQRQTGREIVSERLGLPPFPPLILCDRRVSSYQYQYQSSGSSQPRVSSQPRQNPHENRPHVTTDVGVSVNSPCLRRACTATPDLSDDLCERARHLQPQPQFQPRPRPLSQPQFQPQPSPRPMPQPHRCPDLQTQLCAQYEQPRAQSVSGRPRQHPHANWPHVTTVVGVIVNSPCPRQACAGAIACCERRPEACIEAPKRCGACVEAQSFLECGSGVQHGEESRSIGDWSCCTHGCVLNRPCCRASVVLPESIASSTVPA